MRRIALTSWVVTSIIRTTWKVYRPEVATVPALSKLKLTLIGPEGGKRGPCAECTRPTGLKENVIA